MPINDAEGPNESLSPQDANCLIQFLKSHPGVRLQVVDTTQVLASGDMEDGRLMIGANNTLQTQFGVNRFAVPLHPKRFRLDEPSLTIYRDTVRKEALATARTDHGDDQSERDVGRYGDFEREPDRAEAQRDLTARLTHAFSNHKLIYSPDERTFAFLRGPDVMDEYIELVAEAGFSVMDFKLDSREVPGVCGPAVTALLEKTLRAGDEGGKIDKLKEKDSYRVGPWVIIFDQESRKIIIGNRQFAEEHRARFLT
ncbi:hypothetical protein HYW83_06180 [Candidatus Peregrinibacteria bacterium]|nr:hypothetical protein [Candidatus Peregrinibacteria bacterium]